MEFCPEEPIERGGIEADLRDYFFGIEADFLPSVTPLGVGPIVVGEGDAEAGVAYIVHEAEASTGGEAVAVVIFKKDTVRGYAASLA